MEVIAPLVDSWNRYDMRAVAALFAEDADFVDAFGNWFTSRVARRRYLRTSGDSRNRGSEEAGAHPRHRATGTDYELHRQALSRIEEVLEAAEER